MHAVQKFVVLCLVPTLFACSSQEAIGSDDAESVNILWNGYSYGEVVNDDLLLEQFAESVFEEDIEAIKWLHALKQDDAQAVVDALEQGDFSSLPSQKTTSLPPCSGYWGAHWEHESIEKNNSPGYKYEAKPNYYMWAGDADGNGEGDCGDDYDDYMLSFYLGYHQGDLQTLKAKLAWKSTSLFVSATIYGTVDARVYEQNAQGGPDNYNVYVCVDDAYTAHLETFRIRKY